MEKFVVEDSVGDGIMIKASFNFIVSVEGATAHADSFPHIGYTNG